MFRKEKSLCIYITECKERRRDRRRRHRRRWRVSRLRRLSRARDVVVIVLGPEHRGDYESRRVERSVTNVRVRRRGVDGIGGGPDARLGSSKGRRATATLRVRVNVGSGSLE